MKMFIIFWLCIQNPYTPLDQTCAAQVLYDQAYNTKEECRAASVQLANSLMTQRNVYVTTFCTSKYTPEI